MAVQVGRLPLTYDECRARSRRAAFEADVGQIATGLASVLPGAECFATCLEVGTVDDLAQLAATYQEQRVHRRGDRAVPSHEAAMWAYRCCFTPDDREWEEAAVARYGQHLERALAALAEW